jgi:hypothetical protein
MSTKSGKVGKIKKLRHDTRKKFVKSADPTTDPRDENRVSK